MAGHLKLLFINISESYLSSILEIFEGKDIAIDYLSLQDEKKIEATLEQDTSWDVIIFSEQESPPIFPLLGQLSEKTEHIPLIFLAEKYDSAIVATAMQKGATDCISVNGLKRLMPVIERELQRCHIQNNYLDISKVQHILSKSGITDRSAEEFFLIDGQTLKCKFTNHLPILQCGYSEERISTLQPSDIYSEYDIDSFKSFITPLLEGEREEISICTLVTKRLGMVYPTETHFRKVEHNGSPYIIAINKDISSSWYKVQKMQRQRSLTQKYVRKNKQKEVLLANAAHDMRTSLNTILLSNKLLGKKKNLQLTNHFERLTNAIHYSGQHLLQYIEEFFDTADDATETGPVDTKPTSIDELGNKLYCIFDSVATQKGLSFSYEYKVSDQYTIPTNPTYLKRILKNILSNAFNYTHDGGVTFTIYLAPKEELQDININADKAIAFQVQDTGIGIPKSKLPQVFDRFSRISQPSSSKVNGSGLGLDIVQKLTKSLGGALHIDSDVDAGSTFTLFLPADKEPTSQQPDQQDTQNPSKATVGNTLDKTILVIDDNKMHNLAIKEFLGYSFTKCVAACSIPEAYNILNQQPIDCIILDYLIFDTTSDEVVRDLKSHKKFADIPIIIYTGKKITNSEQESLSEHVTAIIQKNANSHNNLVSTIYASLYSEAKMNHLPS